MWVARPDEHSRAMTLHLVGRNAQLVRAWRKAFRPFPEVFIHKGDILQIAEHCLVSPANSYGFMDGGIDLAYQDFVGHQIERTVREAIARLPEAHLPVGAALVVRTGHGRVPYLIVAPTMVMPGPVESRNSYRALRAILHLAGADAEVGRNIYCPGLATGTGRVPPNDAAEMMMLAYADWKAQREPSVH